MAVVAGSIQERSPELRRSTTAENAATVRRVFDEVINQRRLDVIDEIYDEHILDHDPLPGAPPGREGVRYSIEGLLDGFPDLHVTIEDLSAHGNLVVVHITWRGTQTGRLVGLPPTGHAVTFSGAVIWRLDANRIVERWAVIDLSQQVAIATRARRRLGSALAGDSTNTPCVSLQPVPANRFDERLEFHEPLNGPRRHEFEAARKRPGIRRALHWLMK